MEFNNSWLVQRVLKEQDYINPFGTNVGDTKIEFFDKFNKDYPMDYMGAAEFENGSIEDTLSYMYKQDMHLVKHSLYLENFKAAGVEIYIWHPVKEETKNYINDVFHLYNSGDPKSDLKRKEVSKNDYGSFYQEVNMDAGHNIGWLSLTNKYIFFLNEEKAKSFGKYIDEKEEINVQS
jgi:hypothetical protein